MRSGVVGLQFAIPIYSGGSLSSRVREAIANRTKAEQDLEAARRTVAQAVRQSFIAVNTSLSEIKALQQAVASNKLSVEATKLGQEVGVRTQVDVLNALGLLFDAQFNLVNAYYVAILAQLKLKANVGKLTDADIENVNRLLQPVPPPRTSSKRPLSGSIIDKALLRRAILARRDAVEAPVRSESSRRITDQLLKLPSFDSAAVVLAYLSFGSEFDTSAFVAAILAQGKRLVLPRVNRQLRRLELFAVTDLALDVVPGVWGIREPNPDRCNAAAAGPDRSDPRARRSLYAALRTPRLRRRFLRSIAVGVARARPPAVVAAFELQIVDALPMGPTDVPVDMIVTEDVDSL